MKKLILIGGGGHCKSCIDVIELEKKFEIVGVIDFKEMIGKSVLGYKIIGSDDKLKDMVDENTYFLITLGQIKTAKRRMELFEHLKTFGAKIATIVSPLAYVSKYSKIGEGTIIMHNAQLNAGVSIGQNCTINSKALIEHDVSIEDNCHISTGAIVNGGAQIGKETFIGSNATVVHQARVPQNSFIKAGRVVK